jgi:acetyl esterase/lipase
VTRLLVLQGPGADPSRRGLLSPAPGSPAALDEACRRWGASIGAEVVSAWARDVSGLCAALERAADAADGIVITAGTAAFESAALCDAVVATGVPTVDLHLRDLRRSGPDPARSRLAAAGARLIHGRGIDGYRWALAHLQARIDHPAVEIRYGSGPEHVADLRVPDDTRPPHRVAVLVHGGFWLAPWERDLMDGLAVTLTRDSWATVNVEYRRSGAGGGWPATGEDVCTALDGVAALAAEWGLTLDDVVLIGHSAGAQLALLAGARNAAVRPRLVVGLSGVLDLHAAHAERLGDGAVARLLGDPPPPAALRDASPLANLPVGAPLLLAHLACDPLVPAAHSRAFAAAARSAGDAVTHLELDGDDHFALIDPRGEAWRAVAANLPAS